MLGFEPRLFGPQPTCLRSAKGYGRRRGSIENRIRKIREDQNLEAPWTCAGGSDFTLHIIRNLEANLEDSSGRGMKRLEAKQGEGALLEGLVSIR